MPADDKRNKQEVSLDQIRDMLWNALNERDKDAYVREVYPSHLIYEKDAKYYRIAWSMIDGAVVLGDQAAEVERAWVEARNAQSEFDDVMNHVMRFVAAQDPEGTAWDVTICRPGFTLNGSFLPEQTLRDSAGLFENADVNLYEMPQGATHLPGPLFDVKALLVKNKVGWLDSVRYVAGEGLKGVLHFLDSAKFLGRNLLDAMTNGAQVYGLSWDCLIKGVPDVIDGKSVLRIDRLAKVDSVDIVTRPAAGGKFNRAVAAMPAQNKEEIMKEKLWDLIKEKRPDLLNGKDFATISDQDVEGLARMAMDAPAPQTRQGDPPDLSGLATKEDLEIFRCGMALDAALGKSDLPEPAKERIRKTFEGRVFQSADLDKAVADEKDYLAKVNQIQPPAGGQAASGISVGLGSFDRVCMAVDRTFGLRREDMTGMAALERLDHQPLFGDMRRNVQDYAEFDTVPVFRSLREMYNYFTGDIEVNGRFDRRGLPTELRNVQDINSATFTYVLGNTLGRRLVSLYREYNFQEDLLISIRKPVRDFRTQEAVLVGGFADLATVDPEAADYQEIAGVTDEESTYAVAQKGNILTITRKTIINDDISVIQRLVAKLAGAARRTHAKYVWNFFINNSNCSDATAWFTGGHGNLGAAALSHATAQIAYLALAKMTEKDSGERLGLLAAGDVKPNLIGPVDLMATIEQIANEDFYYTGAADLTTKTPNPLRGKVNPIVLPILTDTNDWGLILPPSVTDIVEMGYLNGRQEPEMFIADSPQSEQVFVADKIRYKIRHEYAGAVIDYRSGYKAVVA